MWKRLQRGTTSNVLVLRLEADGAPVTGKTFSDLSAALWQAGAPSTPLTLETIAALGTYAAPTSAAHLRIKEIDATEQPGAYELQAPDAWFAASAPPAFLLTIREGSTVYCAALAELTPPLSATLGVVTVVQTLANVVGAGVPYSMFRATQKSFPIAWVDSDGDYVSHTGKTYRFVVGDNNNPTSAKFAVDGAGVVISGANDELVTVTVSAADSDIDLPGGHWWLIDTDAVECVAHGEFAILPAATDA